MPLRGETIVALLTFPTEAQRICGVDDQEFAPVGVYDVEIPGQKIIDAAQNLKPKIVVETDDITLDGHQLLIVTVPGLPVQERPASR